MSLCLLTFFLIFLEKAWHFATAFFHLTCATLKTDAQTPYQSLFFQIPVLHSFIDQKDTFIA